MTPYSYVVGYQRFVGLCCHYIQGEKPILRRTCCLHLHVVYHHITSHHITSRHVTSNHITSQSRHITSRHVTSHHITLQTHHITSHHNHNYNHITSRHVTSHHRNVKSHHITSHRITSHHITITITSQSRHVTSHHSHVTSHHITLHHITSHHNHNHNYNYSHITITSLCHNPEDHGLNLHCHENLKSRCTNLFYPIVFQIYGYCVLSVCVFWITFWRMWSIYLKFSTNFIPWLIPPTTF
jgi:hypothetical protein